MSEFKAGDLALIVADDDPQNVGKCVEIVMMVSPGEVYRHPVGNMNSINTSGRSVWLVIGEVVGTDDFGRKFPGFLQKCPTRLIPLRGDFAPESQKSQEVPS